MPSQPPISTLLQPYLSPPSSSLTLLTSTLGVSTNWLVLCFIHAALTAQRQPPQTNLGAGHSAARSHARQDEGPIRVVLVSWLRNASWWSDSGRKLGLDFSRVTIVDALDNSLGLSTTSPGAIDAVEKTILGAISSSSDAPPHSVNLTNSKSVLLILDGIDLLPAATAFSGLSIDNMILNLREHVHATILTASADGSLMDSPSTPLELKHAAFLISMMHQASLVMSVRELDTGVAKDVSGVVRVTKGAGLWDWEVMDEESQEMECLYFVGGDGRAKVFERGT